jgi:hypothetical protein
MFLQNAEKLLYKLAQSVIGDVGHTVTFGLYAFWKFLEKSFDMEITLAVPFDRF